MKYKINISNKEDWMTKCAGKIDESRFEITYSNLQEQKKLHQFDAILPLYETDIVYLNNISGLKNGQHYLVPENSIIALCEDKKLFYDFMITSGFSNYTPLVSNHLKPPYILKKRIDEWGQNSFIIREAIDEQTYREQILSDEFIKQEYFVGKEEYTTHFIFNKGVLSYLFTLKFEFKESYYVKGLQLPPFKNAIITEAPTEFESIFFEILKKLKYSGVGCLNYKIEDGIPKIFEINPRVGGSLPMDVNRFLTHYIDSLKPSFFRKMKNLITG